MIPIAQPLIGIEEQQAVLEVLASGMLAQGPRVKGFEDAFAEYCGARHAVATSSGTTALHVTLLAHGIGPGDEVITTPFTFVATANAILYVGAKPVFVDIDPGTFNINPELLRAALTPRTKAILPVHLFGLPADMDPILDVAERHGLLVVQDACQAHGALYKGKRLGSLSTACFSFYPTKNMTAAEGGMNVTDDRLIAERCRLIRQHGMRQRYAHEELGFNFRMTDVHAAIGLAQLAKLDAFNEQRFANARYLTEHLPGVVTPAVPEESRHVFHQFTIRVPAEQRAGMLEQLRAVGVGAEVYYPLPVHHQHHYRDTWGSCALPEAERACREVLSLPVHPALTSTDLESIVSSVARAREAATAR
jgi:perosamine synthetase